MKITILGADGYYGFPLLQTLKKDHDVIGLDNFSRRKIKSSPSLTPLIDRNDIQYCDITSMSEYYQHLKYFLPDVVIHLAEQRSAPFSMLSYDNKKYTLQNNIHTTLNVLEGAREFNYKVIHIGSMGAYGYETEKFIAEDEKSKNPTSIYHLSKEIDTSLFSFYNRVYDVDIVDLHQGTIWGLGGRFDYDAIYGTVINRFILQESLNIPLTIFGKGDQQRSFINIKNSIDCIKLVLKENLNGFHEFNQFGEILSINEIANIFGSSTQNLKNPRNEKEDNILQSTNEKLVNLGLNIIKLTSVEIDIIKNEISQYLNLVDKELILPNYNWT